jgi:hypothetical protein
VCLRFGSCREVLRLFKLIFFSSFSVNEKRLKKTSLNFTERKIENISPIMPLFPPFFPPSDGYCDNDVVIF